MKKLPLIFVLIAILGAGYYFYRFQNQPVQNSAGTVQQQGEDSESNTQENPTSTATTQLPESAVTPTPPPIKSESTYSSGEEAEMPVSPDILVVQIDYNGTSFAKANELIKAGDIIIFKNSSDSAMRVASDPHPTHTAYPEFDSKTEIAPGGKWQFKFTKKGTWSFHDHLNPEARGVIIVE